MRLKAEEFSQGQYYHLYNHSVSEQLLFQDSEDYLKCLSLFKRYYNTKDYSILAYCLMPNHYHILIYQKTDYPIYTYFENIWSKYSRYYNNRYKRKGTLFAGKLQHIGIRKLQHLLHLCAYIHLNPVKANLVESPEQWQWSNYPEWIRIRNGSMIDREQIKSFFKTKQEYKECLKSLVPEKLDKIVLFDFEKE